MCSTYPKMCSQWMKKIRDDRYEEKRSLAFNTATKKRSHFFTLKFSDIKVNYTFVVNLNKISHWFLDIVSIYDIFGFVLNGWMDGWMDGWCWMKLRPTFAYFIRESTMWLLIMLVPGWHTNELICIWPIAKI